MTFAMIGEILGISKQAAQDTHDRAIAKLRAALGELE